MYRKINDFISAYQLESGNTNKVFRSIDTAKKDEKVHKNIRSAARLAWHIVQTQSEMMSMTGLAESDDLKEKGIPPDFNSIIDEYNKHTEMLLSAVKSKWQDEELEDNMDFFGEQWPKGFLLQSIITHEIHHRAQLTVVMRLLDMPVPGVYGPSREEWVKYNMPAAE